MLGGSFIVACDDRLNLPPATQLNIQDTVHIYALQGTPISQPSGYHVPTRRVMRTDQPGFDIAFDIDAAGTPLMYPAGALGLPSDAGILQMSSTFDEITVAPARTDFVTNQALAIPGETVFVVRSAPYGGDCGFTGALPRYGKFRVLSVDLAARSVALEILINANCGYRDLRPGVPNN
jgi:hypothetical protein